MESMKTVNQNDEELADTLIAISVVSKLLAKKIKEDEQDETTK